MRPLLIRTDASTQIGTGHVMRMMALAQAWRRKGGKAYFYCCQCPRPLQTRLKDAGFPVRMLSARPGTSDDQEFFLQALSSHSDAFVALDGYHFDLAYQSATKAVARVLMVDDYGHLAQYNCDVLLNQNPTATELLLFERTSGARLLQGLDFALLRQEYLDWGSREKRVRHSPLNVLLTLGGSDAGNVTEKLLRALDALPDHIASLRIIIGSANPNRASLERAASSLSIPTTPLVNIHDMPAQLAWADAAVAAAGSTCWELAYMGVPMAVVALAENQRLIAKNLAAHGMAIDLGWHDDLTSGSLTKSLRTLLEDFQLRKMMTSSAQRRVDGKGAARVVANLRATDVLLRSATINDSRSVWNLANDFHVRKASFLPDPIPWADHVCWYEAKLLDPDTHFLIAADRSSEFLGVVRFDQGENGNALISVAVPPEARGLSTGTALIIEGKSWLFANSGMKQIEALIRPQNGASVAAFETAGFKLECETFVHNQPALRYVCASR